MRTVCPPFSPISLLFCLFLVPSSAFTVHFTVHIYFCCTLTTLQIRECVVAQFGGVDLVVDNYSEARSAKVLITQHQMIDVGVRHPVAFAKITLTA